MSQTTAPAEPVHAHTGLTLTEFRRAEARADARRRRLENRQQETEQQIRFDEKVAATNAAITSAPERIGLEAFLAAHPTWQAPKARLLADGQFVLLKPGTHKWALFAGNGMRVAGGVEFYGAGTTRNPEKPAGIRAVTALAERLAAITDRDSRPVPWTSPERDWPQGWQGTDDQTIAGAAAAVVNAWASEQGIDYARARMSSHRQQRPVVGGEQDRDGFYLRRDGEEAAPGDRVRWNDVIQTVVANEIVKAYEGGNATYKLQVTVTHAGEETVITERRLDIAFNGGDPDAPEARRNPGMGMYLTAPGIPVDQQRGQYIQLRREDLVPPGTRILIKPGEDTERYRDQRPTVGTTTDYVYSYQGHTFQVIRYDDQTYDGVKPTAFSRPDPNSKAEYLLDPAVDEQTTARRAWGLDGDGP